MNYRIFNIQIILLLALAFPAIADENETQQKTEPEKSPGLSVDGIKNALGLSIYLQGGYVYNVANPQDQENALRVLDHGDQTWRVSRVKSRVTDGA